MRTKHLFLAFVLAFALSGSNVFAQAGQQKDGKPERQDKRPTPEQIMDFRVKQMQNSLMLDDETADKFAPLYKEYLQALKDCRKPDEKDMKKGPERTNEAIEQAMEEHFTRQQKILDTKKKYFESFKKILNARQLEKVFMPRRGDFGRRPSPAPEAERRNRFFPCRPCHGGYYDACPPCQN